MRAFAALIGFAVALAAVGASSFAGEPSQPPSRPVLVARIHFAPREREQALPGVVKARIETDLGFRVAGKIAVRFVDAGAVVKKGDPLAALDDVDFKLQVEQAEADRNAAASAVEQAAGSAQRVLALHAKGWSSSAEWDKTRSADDQAHAALVKAERAVTLARNALDYVNLSADADGVVGAVFAESGQVVAAGAPIIRLSHTEEREAAVAVPETMVERVRESVAKVEFWAMPGVKIPATLRELSPTADPATRTYPARYSLAGAPEQVRLGMSVTVTLSRESASVAKAPIGAIFDSGSGPTVWVVDVATGRLRAAAVKIALRDSDAVYILEGVSEGDRIVALGVHKLDTGLKVRVIDDLAGL